MVACDTSGLALWTLVNAQSVATGGLGIFYASGVRVSGLLNIQTNADLAKQADEEAARRAADEESQRDPILQIAAHIRLAFQEAKRHKDTHITPRLIACQLQKAGEYEPDTKAKIERAGGCKDFFNITETKTDALEAWIADVITSAGDIPFAVLPTPVPDLAEDRHAEIIEDVTRAYAEASASGFVMSPKDVYEAAAMAYDNALDDAFQQAKTRAAAAEDFMRDQLTEGGWYEAFDECIRDYAMYPTCFLKGPVLMRERALVWQDGRITPEHKIRHTWHRVSPFLAFPAPNVKNTQEGYFCELRKIEAATLQEQRGNPGWNAQQIDGCLSFPPDALQVDNSDYTTVQALIEQRDSQINAGAPASSYWAVEYWGKVRGDALIEWGLDKSDEGDVVLPLTYYEVQAILIGPYVVRAVLNPHPLGRRPYHHSSFVLVSGSIWGRSMVEKMADAQKGYNSASRQMANALAEGSRVRAIIDVDVLDPLCSKDDFPGKQWFVNGNKMSGTVASRKPIDYYQPQFRVDQYLKVLEHYELAADNRTLVPRYVHGDYNIKGAGETASGLSMLMNASHKGIKRSLANIDRGIINPTVTDLYHHNMIYLDDGKYGYLKGDAQIEARGALHLIQQETVQQMRTQFLRDTNNPADMEIIGIEGRAEVLRAIAEKLDLSRSDVVPDRSVLQRRAKAILDRQQQENEQAQLGVDQGAVMPVDGEVMQ